MNVIAFMVLVLAVIFILFIPRISYLVRKMNSKHDDLSLKQKLTKMLTVLVGLLFTTFRKPITSEITHIDYESGESFSTRGLPTVVDNEKPTHIETIRYEWGFLYLDESKLHVNVSDN